VNRPDEDGAREIGAGSDTVSGEWAGVAKALIKAVFTTQERIVTFGHELAEGWEDLIEEVRHERAAEAARPRPAAPRPAPPDAPTPPAPTAPSTPRRSVSTSRPAGSAAATPPRPAGPSRARLAGAAATGAADDTPKRRAATRRTTKKTAAPAPPLTEATVAGEAAQPQVGVEAPRESA
jgi:hypothetical protein